jgi:hypothetical protein
MSTAWIVCSTWGLTQCQTVNELNSKWYVYTEHKTCITHNNIADQTREITVNKQTNNPLVGWADFLMVLKSGSQGVYD